MAEFIISMPVYVLAVNARFRADGAWAVDEDSSFVVVSDCEKRYVPVFLKRHVAEDFQDADGQGEIVALRSRLEAAEVFCRMAFYHGPTHAVIDPQLGERSENTIRLITFIETLISPDATLG